MTHNPDTELLPDDREQALEAFYRVSNLIENFAIDVVFGNDNLSIDWQKVMVEEFRLGDIETIRKALQADREAVDVEDFERNLKFELIDEFPQHKSCIEMVIETTINRLSQQGFIKNATNDK